MWKNKVFQKSEFLEKCQGSLIFILELHLKPQVRFKRNNQFLIQCYPKTMLNEQFKNRIFGLTLGNLMETGHLPMDLHKNLPCKISQDKPSMTKRRLIP